MSPESILREQASVEADRLASVRDRANAQRAALAAEAWAEAPVAASFLEPAPVWAAPAFEPMIDLAEAIDEGRDDAVYAALAAGASPEGSPDVPWAPLHTAAAMDHGAMCEALLAAGADIERRFEEGNRDYCEGWSALHWAAHAAAEGHAARALLSNGADPLARSVHGDTPLHVAVKHGSLPVVGALLAHAHERAAVAGAGPHDGAQRIAPRNAQGDTPLHVGARHGQIKAVEALAAAGADVNAQNALGETPLHAAAAAFDTDMARALMRHGASLGIRSKAGRTPIEEAAQRSALAHVARNEAPGADRAAVAVARQKDLERLHALAEALKLTEATVAKPRAAASPAPRALTAPASAPIRARGFGMGVRL